MRYNNRSGINSLTIFLFGGIAGALAAMLYTPRTGADLRRDISARFNEMMTRAREQRDRILDEAKTTSRDLMFRANNTFTKIKSYAEGRYTGSAEQLELEIKSLKNAINKAVDTYKNYGKETRTTDDMIKEIFAEYEDESLPKQEGMGRRME